VARVTGACLVVPVMEELLWRSFLMRWLINKDFLGVSLGTYTHISFWITVFCFVSVHRPWEWGVTLVAGILYGAYLVRTKNLVGCVIAHAVTNLGLAVYVVYSGSWFYW